MNDELNRELVGVDWNFSQYIRDNVMESLSGVKGDNSVKIFGPDLDELESLAEQGQGDPRRRCRGVENVGVFRIKGQPNLEFRVDREKCKFWGVTRRRRQERHPDRRRRPGRSRTMIEGEKHLRHHRSAGPRRCAAASRPILDIPVDVTNNQVTPGYVPGIAATPVSGAGTGVATTGTSVDHAVDFGNIYNGSINNSASVPRLRLRDLVTPVDADGRLDPAGPFLRPGPRRSTASRASG